MDNRVCKNRVPHGLIWFGRKTLQHCKDVRGLARYHLIELTGRVPRLGNDKTVYILGLFGSGRLYVNELMLQNIGERARYFRDEIFAHQGPTSVIYSGHATIKYPSRGQAPPQVAARILEAVKSGFADSIFVYRHPLDSLLTNWVWWRTFMRQRTMIRGLSFFYENRDNLCADLEQNFSEFEAFAAGDPSFYRRLKGLRFLSFREFVEETELHLASASLPLRLEDFIIDPAREFSKIAELMSVKFDSTRFCGFRPRTKPYGYLAAEANVPQFRRFIAELDDLTKRRIEKSGYSVEGVHSPVLNASCVTEPAQFPLRPS